MVVKSESASISIAGEDTAGIAGTAILLPC